MNCGESGVLFFVLLLCIVFDPYWALVTGATLLFSKGVFCVVLSEIKMERKSTYLSSDAGA